MPSVLAHTCISSRELLLPLRVTCAVLIFSLPSEPSPIRIRQNYRLRGVLRQRLLPLRCPYLHLRVPVFLRVLRTLVFFPTAFARHTLDAFAKALRACFGVLNLVFRITDTTHFLNPRAPLDATRRFVLRLLTIIDLLRVGAEQTIRPLINLHAINTPISVL